MFGAFADFGRAQVDACWEDVGQLHDAQDAAFTTASSGTGVVERPNCECGLSDIDRSKYKCSKSDLHYNFFREVVSRISQVERVGCTSRTL